MKNVWLKDNCEELLKNARFKYLAKNKEAKLTDNNVIEAALAEYIKT